MWKQVLSGNKIKCYLGTRAVIWKHESSFQQINRLVSGLELSMMQLSVQLNLTVTITKV